MRQYLLLILTASIIFSSSAYAQNVQNIEIVISSSNYNYGEKLDYTIIVSEITGEDAIIFITNTNGNKSQLLSIPISQEESRIIAPFAFDSVIWSEGTYELELQYSGATSITSFTIVNDGTIGIPYWIKDVSKIWVSGQAKNAEEEKLDKLMNACGDGTVYENGECVLSAMEKNASDMRTGPLIYSVVIGMSIGIVIMMILWGIGKKSHKVLSDDDS